MNYGEVGTTDQFSRVNPSKDSILLFMNVTAGIVKGVNDVWRLSTRKRCTVRCSMRAVIRTLRFR
jgi:hypothetical protein